MFQRMPISRAGLVGALLTSCFAIGCAMDDGAGKATGDPGAAEADVQQRVDEVLASIPGGHQVSATEVDYDGLTVTFDPNYSAEKSAVAPARIICTGGCF